MSDAFLADFFGSTDMKSLLLPLLIGALAGLVAALCGVGGGIVLVPCFVMLLGMTQQNAVATSLAVIAPAVLVASFKNTSNELIDWKIFVPTVIGAMLVAWIAADWLKTLSNDVLKKIFAVVLLVFGAIMLFRRG